MNEELNAANQRNVGMQVEIDELRLREWTCYKALGVEPSTTQSALPYLIDQLRADKEKAEAACAEKDKALERIRKAGEHFVGGKLWDSHTGSIAAEALSSTCGHGYVSRKDVAEWLRRFRGNYDFRPDQEEDLARLQKLIEAESPRL